MITGLTVCASLPSEAMRPIAGIVALAVGVAGCGVSAPAPRRAARPHASDPPAAEAPLPRSASGLAGALAETSRTAEADVRAWRRTRPPAGAQPPGAIALRALYQQRIYRYMRRHPTLTDRVIAALPASLRGQARDNVAAGLSLLRLAPKKPP